MNGKYVQLSLKVTDDGHLTFRDLEDDASANMSSQNVKVKSMSMKSTANPPIFVIRVKLL